MKWKEGQSFENPPSGSHLARCYALIDLGTQARPAWQGEERPPARMVRISFELPNAKMTGKYNADVKGKPFSVHVTTKQSLHAKASLRRLLEGWRGRKFDAATIEKFDPSKLVGLPCRLALVQNGEYVNVDSIAPATPDEAKKLPKMVNPPTFLSLSPDEFSQEVFEALHEKTREKIAKSPEFISLDNPVSEEPQADACEPSEAIHEGAENDDVPF